MLPHPARVALALSRRGPLSAVLRPLPAAALVRGFGLLLAAHPARARAVEAHEAGVGVALPSLRPRLALRPLVRARALPRMPALRQRRDAPPPRQLVGELLELLRRGGRGCGRVPPQRLELLAREPLQLGERPDAPLLQHTVQRSEASLVRPRPRLAAAASPHAPLIHEAAVAAALPVARPRVAVAVRVDALWLDHHPLRRGARPECFDVVEREVRQRRALAQDVACGRVWPAEPLVGEEGAVPPRLSRKHLPHLARGPAVDPPAAQRPVVLVHDLKLDGQLVVRPAHKAVVALEPLHIQLGRARVALAAPLLAVAAPDAHPSDRRPVSLHAERARDAAVRAPDDEGLQHVLPPKAVSVPRVGPAGKRVREAEPLAEEVLALAGGLADEPNQPVARAAAARPERVAQLVEGVEPHHPLLRQVHLELLVGAPRCSAVVLLLPPPLLLLLLLVPKAVVAAAPLSGVARLAVWDATRRVVHTPKVVVAEHLVRLGNCLEASGRRLLLHLVNLVRVRLQGRTVVCLLDVFGACGPRQVQPRVELLRGGVA
mmetsp:Transcript_3395/g.11364  ORF Transcript_3395/g.11364 Transcript_3395/m.11364 type:complete len:546 (+) Transcript_3395:292-1929(+)